MATRVINHKDGIGENYMEMTNLSTEAEKGGKGCWRTWLG